MMKHLFKILIVGLIALGCSGYEDEFEDVEFGQAEQALLTPPNNGVRFPDTFGVRLFLENGDFFFNGVSVIGSYKIVNFQDTLNQVQRGLQPPLLFDQPSTSSTTDVYVRKNGQALCDGPGCWPYKNAPTQFSLFHMQAFDEGSSFQSSSP